MAPEVVVLLLVLFAVALAALGLVLSRRSAARSRGAVPGEPPATPGASDPESPGVGTAVLEPEAPPDVGAAPAVEVEPPPEADVDAPGTVAEPEVAVRPRLRDRLGRTRAAFGQALSGLAGRTKVDPETWEELEEALILADVGVTTTQRILDDVRTRATEQKVSDPAAVIGLLRDELTTLLEPGDRTLVAPSGEINVWMFVGVNGVGKTTTLAKLAQRATDGGQRVVLAAADTFRAAAAEQLGLWADRVGAELVRGQEGADPGSVVFDAMSAAATRDADLVLVDTAGRLHTKVNLMEELKKLRRIVERTPGALKEVLLVIDASTGQNGLAQARQFAEAVEVTGVVLTKLDGTAKGGIVLAIQAELGIPVKVVGVGESAEDLVPFDPAEFVDAMLP